MLYDPKWEVKADPFSLESLIAWLEKQPGETTYSYYSSNCLVCRYLKAHGIATSNYRSVADCQARMTVAAKEPYTYGAALERARAIRQ